MKTLEFTYLMQPPKRFTFQQQDLKLWTEKWCMGRVLNLFAGVTRLNIDETRVDINEDVPSDYCMDALEFICSWSGELFDTVILDPPYNVRKSREKYSVNEKTYYVGKLKKIKNALPPLLNSNGRVISFGYDSVGMSRSRGFAKVAICLVCHSGDHNDTICLVEKMTEQQRKLF